MTLATMHAKLCVFVCVCVAGVPAFFFQNNQLYACTVMSGQGSLLHVKSWTQNDTEPECKLFSEGKRSQQFEPTSFLNQAEKQTESEMMSNPSVPLQ